MHAETAIPQTNTIDRLQKGLLLALVIAVVGFAAYYAWDRRHIEQPTLMERAVVVAEDTVREDPGDPVARVGLAELYLAKDRVAEAVGQFQAALEIDSKYLPARRGLGLAYLAQAQFADAEREFQWVVDTKKDGEFANADKGLSEAYYFLAATQVEQQRPTEAIPSLQAALRIDKGDSDAWMMLGRAQLASGEPSEAVTALTRATAFAPKYSEAYGLLAQAHETLGDQDRAAYARAMVDFSDGKLSSAISGLRAVVQAKPDLWEAWTGLGLASESNDQKEHAADAYQRALTANPSDFNARAGLIRLGQLKP
jgi:cytochrome c-type biogenesis protein CcmH/NrfG